MVDNMTQGYKTYPLDSYDYRFIVEAGGFRYYEATLTIDGSVVDRYIYCTQ